MVPQQVSFVERSSLSQRVPYRRFHWIYSLLPSPILVLPNTCALLSYNIPLSTGLALPWVSTHTPVQCSTHTHTLMYT